MGQVKHVLEGKKVSGVVSIAPTSPVLDALRLMAEHGIGAVLVMDGQKLVGILSERDYARKVVLLGRTSATTPVSEIMSHEVVCARPGDDVHQCMQVMTEKRVRHLPILDHKEVVGLVSIGDLVKAVIDDQKTELRYLQDYITS